MFHPPTNSFGGSATGAALLCQAKAATPPPKQTVPAVRRESSREPKVEAGYWGTENGQNGGFLWIWGN